VIDLINPDGTEDVVGGFKDEDEARTWLRKNAGTASLEVTPLKPHG